MRLSRASTLLATVALLGGCDRDLPTAADHAPTLARSSSTGVGTTPDASPTTVLNFDELETTEGAGTRVPSPYTVEGYVLATSTGNRFFSPSSTYRWYGGSAALFADDITGTRITLSREDGSSFAISSISLARLFGEGTAEVTFVGTTREGATVQQRVFVEGRTFKEFPLTGFEDLVELRWSQAKGFSPLLHQFDDLVLTLVNPGSREACFGGGWKAYGFKNQGQCVAFVDSGRDSR